MNHKIRQIPTLLPAKVAHQGKQMRVGACEGFAYFSVKVVLLANGNVWGWFQYPFIFFFFFFQKNEALCPFKALTCLYFGHFRHTFVSVVCGLMSWWFEVKISFKGVPCRVPSFFFSTCKRSKYAVKDGTTENDLNWGWRVSFRLGTPFNQTLYWPYSLSSLTQLLPVVQRNTHSIDGWQRFFSSTGKPFASMYNHCSSFFPILLAGYCFCYPLLL